MPRSDKTPGKRRKTEARGTQYGNTRGKERQKRRAELRRADPRYQQAMAERAETERALRKYDRGESGKPHPYTGFTRRLLASLQEPVVLPTQATKESRDKQERTGVQTPLVDRLARPAEPAAWSLGQARGLIRQGYRIDHVIAATGWGPDWFDDLSIDDDGYGLSTREWLDAQGGK